MTPASSAGSWRVSGPQSPLRQAICDALAEADSLAPTAAEAAGTIAVLPRGGAPTEPVLAALAALRAGRRVWLVTQDGVQLHPDDVIDPAQAAVWGLGAALARELPDHFCGTADVQGPADAAALVAAVRAPAGEDRIAVRGDRLSGQRLQPAPYLEGHWSPKPTGTILITGGLGALGRQLAEWLVSRGARQLVLVSRRAQRAAWVDALEQGGARVQVVAADVSDEASVGVLLSGLQSPLQGVIHAAGIGEEADSLHLTPEGLEAVWAGKVRGALHLDRLTASLPLDFFVLMGSVSAVWGAARLAAYASANGLLAGLAAARRAAGRPALCVDWGPWSGDGMGEDADTQMLARVGIQPLTPAAALRALEVALASDAARVTVADVAWSTLRQLLEVQRPTPLFEPLASPVAQSAPDWLPALESCAPADRAAWLSSRIQVLLAATMEAPDPSQVSMEVGFFDLGLSSMMVLELRDKLQGRLPLKLTAANLFNHPTATRLAAFILDRLALTSAPETHDEIDPDTEEMEPESDILSMSDEEVAALLEVELADLD